MQAREPVYLVDASIYVFRAWFSIPDSLTGPDGHPINALYGFARFVTEIVEQTEASHIAVAFDESLSSSFRNEVYPPYKANRELPPAELERQFQWCRRFAEAAGLACYAHDRFEADDLIGTLATSLRSQGFRIVLVTADKDMAQLVEDDDEVWDYSRNARYGSQGVYDKFGVWPHQIVDYLGLAGDAVDNIPGVPGIGPKSASAMLQQFETLEILYERLDGVADLKFRGARQAAGKLVEHREQAFLSRDLASIVCDVPIETAESSVRRRSAELLALRELIELMGGRGEGLSERLQSASRGIL
jgi:DNA polymerase-1